MPNSLWDMFQPQDAAGQPASLGDAFTSRSNSLIGLGLGLLAPSNPLRGQSSWGQALEGFQGGAQIDARTAAAAAQPSFGREQHITANTSSMSLVVAGPLAHVFDTFSQASTARSLACTSVDPQTTLEDTSRFGSIAAQRCCWAHATPVKPTATVARMAKSPASEGRMPCFSDARSMDVLR